MESDFQPALWMFDLAVNIVKLVISLDKIQRKFCTHLYSAVRIDCVIVLCCDVASNAALCVQFRNHSDHMELFINGRFRGEPAEPGG